MTAIGQLIQINRPAIIDETIDGEVVVVDLERGSYYSIRDGGVTIWQSLIEPTTPERVVRDVAQRVGRPVEELAPVVTDFIEELEAHGLLREADRPPVDPPGPPASPADIGTFELPLIERFTDMEDLLMLDPVHEVDERGWPHAAPS